MNTPLQVLIVEDSEDDALLVVRELRRGGYDVTFERVDTAAAMAAAIERQPWAVVIADYSMPHFSGLDALQLVMEKQLDIPVVIVSATIGEDVAVATMRAGARDYVMKSNLKRLAPAVARELREAERRREHRRVEAERKRLVTAIEQAAEAVVITDPEGTIQYVNPAFHRITGYTREEVLGQNPRVLKSEEHDRAFYQKLWDTITSGDTWNGRFTNKKKDGTLYLEDATISPVCDNSGKIVNFVSVKRDITREVALEKELRQAQKMEAVGQLAGGVAHDFNNLLTAITGYAELVQDELADNQRAIEFLGYVMEAAAQAAGVTRSLLTFSRKTEADKESVDLRKVVQKSSHFLRHVLPTSIELVADVAAAEALWVSADSTQLQQVIMNLAVNARDAMPDGGTLRVAASYGAAAIGSATAEVRLVVSDTGTGMAPEVREHIFEPFFTTKPRGQGTGLGLSIIHGIVKDHGGSIDVESEPGRGTTFTVTLPGLEAEAVAEMADPATAAPRGHGELVLLAEDDEHVRRIIASTLEALDYEVLQISDGEALLAAFERHRARVRLIVTDIEMPKRGGLTCLRDIRASGAATPAVLITASVDVDIEDQLDEDTVLLRKPFQLTALATLVGHLCGVPGAAEKEG